MNALLFKLFKAPLELLEGTGVFGLERLSLLWGVGGGFRWCPCVEWWCSRFSFEFNGIGVGVGVFDPPLLFPVPDPKGDPRSVKFIFLTYKRNKPNNRTAQTTVHDTAELYYLLLSRVILTFDIFSGTPDVSHDLKRQEE